LETLAELSPRDVIILTRLKDLYRTLPGRGQSPHNLKPHFPDLTQLPMWVGVWEAFAGENLNDFAGRIVEIRK